jgi:ribosome-binding protein aMBF1 (putative translation factor)
VFKAAKDVLAFNGTLTSENTIAKTLMAKVDTNTIWVKVDEVEPNITRVVVQARSKGGFSNQDLASEIDKQIALQLR